MAKVNDEGKEYIADVSSGLRLTADIPNGELGYVLMAQLITRYGITELLGITESDLNTQTRVGVYKYGIMQPGATKTDYGLLFVYSSDVPTSGSGDYPLYQTRFQGGVIQTRSRTMPNGLWSDWEDVGGSPDAVLKNASNEVGDTFALTSQNDNGDITVSSGRNGETNLTGGRVRVDSSNGATEIDGMGVNITSTGNASVSAYTVSLNATNGNAKVEGSRGVNISSTNGDINLNPGGQGKAKVNGKEIATKDATVAFAGLYNEEEIDACDIPGNYGCNIQGGYSLFGTDFAIIVLSSGDDSTYRIQIGIKNDLSVIAARYGQAGSWGEWTEIGGGSSVEVVQTTGQSTTAVMSQKAVTDELAKKATKAELNLLNEGIMKDEGLYEDVDTYGEAYSRTSTNGEMMGYINHRIADYEVSTDDPSVFTYDGQMHVMKLAQFTLKPENNDLQFIEQNYRGVLIDPTWSYVNFVYSGMVKYFSANIGGGKCILSDAAGYTNNANYYIQLYAEACYGGSNGINVTIFAEYKLPTSTPDQNPLYINGSLEGYLRVWIV